MMGTVKLTSSASQGPVVVPVVASDAGELGILVLVGGLLILACGPPI
jgi:hypothetical protein